MGALAREIGADDVNLKVLAPPDRDIHTLQAKPTMMRSLRSADLVLAVGADLEVGLAAGGHIRCGESPHPSWP